MTFIYDIRPITDQDIPKLLELFRSTVLTVNSRDYTKEETEHWKELLAKNDFIGALDRQGNIIGFSSMDCNGHLHSMFVHKNWQGCGVATQLLSEVEKVAQKYGVDKIHSEVSITARSFFEQHGYRTMKEQKQKANQLFLTNYKMEKVLK